MNITLEYVRQVLRETLGFHSFVAGFITRIQEDASQPTAGITKDGLLAYNPHFIEEYISCREDLFSLIFHEILHPLFGHFLYRNGLVENVATDAIINAAISTLYGKASRNGNLFRKTHAPHGLPGLLRPESEMANSRYEKLYLALYPRLYNTNRLTTGELIQTLRILLPAETATTILLLGTHGEETAPTSGEWPAEILARFSEEIRRNIRQNVQSLPGHCQGLADLVVEALETRQSIQHALLERFTTQEKIDRFKSKDVCRRLAVSPVLLTPSKRDVMLLASGMDPLFYHNERLRPHKQNRGLAVYLDVSGSVDQYLPRILGVLKNLKDEIQSVFLFSNQVVETGFKALQRGQLRSTGGTDFNCIARSILERNFDKAIVITDGYASMNPGLQQKLRERKLKTLTILFDRRHTCPDFEPFGDVVHLDEICHERR